MTEGSVTVTPRNPALPPFALSAGQQVVVGPDGVDAITLLCLPGQCDDGEACTVDTCTPSACQSAPATGFDAVCSACQGGLGSGACAGQPVPSGVGKRIARACSLREQAGTKPQAAQKLLRQAKKSLKAARALTKKAAKRKAGAISADCAGAIASALGGPF